MKMKILHTFDSFINESKTEDLADKVEKYLSDRSSYVDIINLDELERSQSDEAFSITRTKAGNRSGFIVRIDKSTVVGIIGTEEHPHYEDKRDFQNALEFLSDKLGVKATIKEILVQSVDSRVAVLYISNTLY